MPSPQKLKKSESLEIRIPHSTKQAFMARCRDEGRSASDALRGFIEQDLAGATPPPRAARRRSHLIIGALLAAAAGAVALPSLARPTAQSEFERLDVNGDHQLSLAELARVDSNGDGRISFDEYRRNGLP